MSKKSAIAVFPLLISALPSFAAGTEGVFEDVIVVTAKRLSSDQQVIYGEAASASSADITSAIAKLPGASFIKNGSLSGQVQYRGAYGFRVGNRINGSAFSSGGPNLMDPPMHYAPPVLVDNVQVHRGAAPLSFGPSLIGGVNATLKQIPFGESQSLKTSWDVSMIGRSADNSHALGTVFGAANDRFRAYGLYSSEQGDDISSPEGDIDNTFHDRRVIGAGFGLMQDDDEWTLEIRRQDTGNTGNPPFAMDIDYFETDFAQLTFKRTIGLTELKAIAGYSEVDHVMDNFNKRPAPADPMRYRATRATADSLTFSLALLTEFGSGDLSWGLDAQTAEHNVRIGNPLNPNFFINSLPDISQQRIGAYLSWAQSFGPGEIDVGVRSDWMEDDAGEAQTGPALGAGPSGLAAAFNLEDRTWHEDTVDLLARYWQPTAVGTWRMTVARKNRTPTYLERFGWLPTPASAGLADGNTYVGDRNLKPETAWVIESGIDIEKHGWWLRPSIYYHQIDDFIHGVPFDATVGRIDSPVERVSAMSGDPTPLRFANVDAKMYGVDTDYGWQLSDNLTVEGVLSIVRGERRDISDDLYRISPDRMTMSLVYSQQDWSASIEAVGVRRQSNVSDSNSELKTPGYGLLNLHGHWQANESLLLRLGIENLADRSYADHMAGYNRIADSVVPVGSRLPGVGRNIFLQLSWHST